MTTKLVKLIKDFKILIHGILYIVTFMVMKISLIDSTYSILIRCPWLWDVKVPHDQGTNQFINIEGNGTITIILVNKRLNDTTKQPKALLCYDFFPRVTHDEEETLLIVEPNLLFIGTFTLHALDQCWPIMVF